jgi:hypothetical protein
MVMERDAVTQNVPPSGAPASVSSWMPDDTALGGEVVSFLMRT